MTIAAVTENFNDPATIGTNITKTDRSGSPKTILVTAGEVRMTGGAYDAGYNLWSNDTGNTWEVGEKVYVDVRFVDPTDSTALLGFYLSTGTATDFSQPHLYAILNDSTNVMGVADSAPTDHGNGTVDPATHPFFGLERVADGGGGEFRVKAIKATRHVDGIHIGTWSDVISAFTPGVDLRTDCRWCVVYAIQGVEGDGSEMYLGGVNTDDPPPSSGGNKFFFRNNLLGV